MAKVAKKVIKKRRDRKNIDAGHAHIRSTFNRTQLRLQQKQLQRELWNMA